MAGKACHVFGSTTRFGLTQALGRKGISMLTKEQANSEADRVLTPHRVLQDMDATSTTRRRTASRTWLYILIPVGWLLGYAFAKAIHGPPVLYELAGFVLGAAVAAIIGRRAA